MAIIQAALIILIVASVIMTIVEIFNLHFFFRKSRTASPLKRYPAVSIIKALKGIDAHLIENLESFCDIDYPKFEIIFAVASPDDPVIPLINYFMSQSGKTNMKLVVDPSAIGYNPQISNFSNGYKASTGEIVIFSDSDTRATPDFIRRLIVPLEDERVGISSGFAVFRGSQGFWSLAKCITYNSSVPLYNALWCRFIPITVGAAMAIRREVFEKIGGFKPIADKLTTDQELGKLVGRHGYRAKLAPYLIAMYEGRMPFVNHIKQIMRWLVAIKVASPVDYNFILLTNTAFLSFIFWLFVPADRFHIAVLAGTVVFRTLTPLYVHSRYIKDPKVALHSWMILPIDFILPVLWLIGQWHRRVTWRGTDFIVRKGKLAPVEKGGK
ncbi:MAG: glycosyltransferase [Candidatus Aminicenantes bacterium]|nr:glycosyltransferase [Candidatus Aminicenantes bacterium]